jgi:hypothetical protein
MGKGRLAELQGSAYGLGCRGFPDQVAKFLYALVEGTSGDSGTHIGNLADFFPDSS